MARRRTTAKRRTPRTSAATRRKAPGRRKSSDKLVNFFVPLFLIGGIVVCLGAILFVSFRSVAATSFFEVEKIETEGLSNISRESIVGIVHKKVAGRGVWEADLESIRVEIAKLDYVRHVSVSRLLPGTIRVIVDERTPVGRVRVGDQTFRVDADARLLEKADAAGENETPFVLLGWDMSLADKSRAMNKKRLDLYLKLANEWREFELDKRVVAVRLDNARDVEALITESGESVSLSLGNDDFADRLKDGIKIAAGNGKRISKIILDGASPVIVYRD